MRGRCTTRDHRRTPLRPPNPKTPEPHGHRGPRSLGGWLPRTDRLQRTLSTSAGRTRSARRCFPSSTPAGRRPPSPDTSTASGRRQRPEPEIGGGDGPRLSPRSRCVRTSREHLPPSAPQRLGYPVGGSAGATNWPPGGQGCSWKDADRHVSVAGGWG